MWRSDESWDGPHFSKFDNAQKDLRTRKNQCKNNLITV